MTREPEKAKATMAEATKQARAPRLDACGRAILANLRQANPQMYARLEADGKLHDMVRRLQKQQEDMLVTLVQAGEDYHSAMSDSTRSVLVPSEDQFPDPLQLPRQM